MGARNASAPGPTGATRGTSRTDTHHNLTAALGPSQPPPDRWIRVAQLAEAEDTSPRAVYHAIDSGMRHSRRGRSIRVRIVDWRRWWERAAVGGER